MLNQEKNSDVCSVTGRKCVCFFFNNFHCFSVKPKMDVLTGDKYFPFHAVQDLG